MPDILIRVEGDGWPSPKALRKLAAKAVAATMAGAGLAAEADAELSLLFTDDAAMTAINAQWRGIAKPTNVLSFPGAEIAVGQKAGPVLGDIVFARQTIDREAKLDGKPFEHHLSHLIVHGLLHIFGYDHEDGTQAELMETQERRILAALGICDPYGSGEAAGNSEAG